VTSSFRMIRHRSLRLLRRAVAVFVLMAYLGVGILHGSHDINVANPAGSAVVSLADKGIGHADHGIVGDHHCHGCFSVSVSAPITTAALIDVWTRAPIPHDAEHRGLSAGIDLPPPKSLT